MVIGSNSKDGWSLDHKTPRIKGGTSSPDNLVLCCRSCNSIKRTLEYETFSTIGQLYQVFADDISMGDWAKAIKEAYELYRLYPELTCTEAFIVILQGRRADFGRDETFENFVVELAQEMKSEHENLK